MDLHKLSDSVTDVWKHPKKGFKRGGVLIRSTKIKFKQMKFGMVVNWPKYFFVDTQI